MLIFRSISNLFLLTLRRMQLPRNLLLTLVVGVAPTAACITDGSDGSDEIGGTGDTGTDTAGDTATETGDTANTSDTGTDTGEESTCVSGTFWTLGNMESPLMHPGNDCLDCHQSMGEVPWVVMAGTVYTNSHELDDCNGVSGVDVLITDMNGANYQTTTNAAGNFLFENVNIVPPYKAQLMYEGRMREMAGMQTVASCNSCHTEMGAQGAPGRILAP